MDTTKKAGSGQRHGYHKKGRLRSSSMLYGITNGVASPAILISGADMTLLSTRMYLKNLVVILPKEEVPIKN